MTHNFREDTTMTTSTTARPAYEVVHDPGPEATVRSVWHAARAWAWLQATNPGQEAGLTRERIADWRMLALAEWELMLVWVALEGERSAREVANLMSAAPTEPELVELHIRRRLDAAGIDPTGILPASTQGELSTPEFSPHVK